MADQPYTEAEVEAAAEAMHKHWAYEAGVDRGPTPTERQMWKRATAHALTAAASVRQGELERLREVIRAHDADRELGQCYGLLSDAATAAPTEGESDA